MMHHYTVALDSHGDSIEERIHDIQNGWRVYDGVIRFLLFVRALTVRNTTEKMLFFEE